MPQEISIHGLFNTCDDIDSLYSLMISILVIINYLIQKIRDKIRSRKPKKYRLLKSLAIVTGLTGGIPGTDVAQTTPAHASIHQSRANMAGAKGKSSNSATKPQPIPTKKDGSRDMRYKENQDAIKKEDEDETEPPA
jgi:hypothetical protein